MDPVVGNRRVVTVPNECLGAGIGTGNETKVGVKELNSGASLVEVPDLPNSTVALVDLNGRPVSQNLV